MTDLGTLQYFLGLKLSSTGTRLLLTQTKYATDVLRKFGLLHSKSCKTPCALKEATDTSVAYSTNESHLFRQMAGALQYLTFSHPNVAYTVSKIFQFMHQPLLSHLVALKRILGYVRGTLSHGLHFTKGSLDIRAFSDSSWAGDRSDRRSTTGSVVCIGSTPISWGAQK